MTIRPRLATVVLDATDVRLLAEFYRRLLGLHYRAGDEPPADPADDHDDWLVLLHPSGARALAVQLVEELAPTTWPSPEVPQQMHLDTTVPTVEALEACKDEALALGATIRLDRSADTDEPLYALADPAGHVFCIFVAPDPAD